VTTARTQLVVDRRKGATKRWRTWAARSWMLRYHTPMPTPGTR